MQHLILSPHPDDAVLSCGGLVYRLAQSGERMTVYTVMAGALPSDVRLSPFIEEHLQRWGLGTDPVPARREEERRALEVLGAKVEFGEIPDALYRTDGRGMALYPDLERLFGEVHPDDPALAEHPVITAPLEPGMTVYAPLGAGHHVDHVLVRDAVQQWIHAIDAVAVFFYEEYPYSADGVAVVQAALDALGEPVEPVIQHLDSAAINAKIKAIACHESQISTFWRDSAAMAQAVRAYASDVGKGVFAERFWRLV